MMVVERLVAVASIRTEPGDALIGLVVNRGPIADPARRFLAVDAVWQRANGEPDGEAEKVRGCGLGC